MDLVAGRDVRFGPFRLSFSDRLLYRGEELVRLPPKAVDTLLVLVASHGHVVSKDEMMSRIWPDTIVEEGALAQYISALRKALGEHGVWIENHPRRGYRFTGPVEPVEPDAGESEGAGRNLAEDGRPQLASTFNRRRFALGWAAAFGAGAGAVAIWSASRASPKENIAAALGAGQSEAYRHLARARALTARMATPAELDEAEVVLEEAIAADPSVADAYGLLSYIHVRRYNQALSGTDSLRSAISFANQALSKDPESPPAMRALVDVHHLTDRPVEALLMAQTAIKKDPTGVHTIAAAAEAYFRAGLYERAIPLYQRALAAEPENRAFRGQLVRMHLFLKNHAEGLELISSLAPSAVGQWGMLLFAEVGMMDKAVEVARTDPETQLIGLFGFFRGCVLAEAGDEPGAVKIWQDAVRLGEARSRDYDNSFLHQWLSLRYAKLGDREKALQHMEASLAIDPGNSVLLFLAAETESFMGNQEAALRKLKAAADGGFSNAPMVRHLSGRMFAFHGLRDHPKFLAVLAQMESTAARLSERF